MLFLIDLSQRVYFHHISVKMINETTTETFFHYSKWQSNIKIIKNLYSSVWTRKNQLNASNTTEKLSS